MHLSSSPREGESLSQRCRCVCVCVCVCVWWRPPDGEYTPGGGDSYLPGGPLPQAPEAQPVSQAEAELTRLSALTPVLLDQQRIHVRPHAWCSLFASVAPRLRGGNALSNTRPRCVLAGRPRGPARSRRIG